MSEPLFTREQMRKMRSKISKQNQQDYVPIQVTTGNIVADEGSGKMYVFHCPCPSSVRHAKTDQETYLNAAVNTHSRLGTAGAKSKMLARPNIQEEIGGKTFSTAWTLMEGEVLKLFAQGRSGQWNSPQRTAIMYIRIRAEGPLNRVQCTVPECVYDSAIPSWDITGRFDVLTPEQAEDLGVKVTTKSYGNKVSVDSLFKTEQLAAQIRTLPKIRMKRVGGRVMPVNVPRRNLDI